MNDHILSKLLGWSEVIRRLAVSWILLAFFLLLTSARNSGVIKVPMSGCCWGFKLLGTAKKDCAFAADCAVIERNKISRRKRRSDCML